MPGCRLLLACCLAVLGPAAAAAVPRWGAPVNQAPAKPNEVVTVARDAGGVARVLRVAIPVPDGLRPDLAVTRNLRGDLFAMWVSEGLPVVAYQPAGGTAARRLIDQDADTGGSVPAVAINAAGDAAGAWAGKAGANLVVFRSAATGELSAPATVSAPDRAVGSRQVAVTADGTVIALWTESTTEATVLMWSMRDPATGAWRPAAQLARDPVDVQVLDLRLDAAGNATALWASDDPENARPLRTARMAAGTVVWEQPLLLGRLAAEEVPDLAVAAGGNVAVAFPVTRGDVNHLAVAVRPAGGAWGRAERLGPGPVTASGPEIDVSDSGHVAVVWTRAPRVALAPVARARVRLAGAGWSPAQDLGTPAGAAATTRFATAVAIGEDGTALAMQSVLVRSGTRDRVATFSEQPRPLRRPTLRIMRVVADAVPSGALLWLRVRLNAGVENARLIVQQQRGGRWLPVGSRTVSGVDVAIPVRVTGAGRRTYRLVLRSGRQTPRSRPVAVRVTRPPVATVAVGRDPVAVAVAGDLLWVLSRDGARSRLHRLDPVTGRSAGRPLAADGVVDIAGGRRTLWMLGDRRVTALDVPTLRRAPAVRLSRRPADATLSIGARGDSAWIALTGITSLFEEDTTTLVRVDRSGRVVRRVRVPPSGEVAFTGRIQVGAGGVWLTSEGALGGSVSTRFDPRTGRFATDFGPVAVGAGAAWEVGDVVRRVIPASGIAARPPLTRGGTGEDGRTVFVPIALTPAAVGTGGVWAVSSAAGRPAARRIDPVSAATGPAIAVAPRVPPVRDPDVTGTPQIVAARGTVWMTVPPLGVIVRIPGAR